MEKERIVGVNGREERRQKGRESGNHGVEGRKKEKRAMKR